MKLAAGLIALATLITSATAHTLVWGVWVNGVDQGDGRSLYVRSPPNNNPVKDLTSAALACNVNNTREHPVLPLYVHFADVCPHIAVPKYVEVKAGDQLTFEWYHNVRNDDIIARYAAASDI